MWQGVLPKHLLKMWDAGTTTWDVSERNTLSKDEFLTFADALFERCDPDLWETEVWDPCMHGLAPHTSSPRHGASCGGRAVVTAFGHETRRSARRHQPVYRSHVHVHVPVSARRAQVRAVAVDIVAGDGAQVLLDVERVPRHSG